MSESLMAVRKNANLIRTAAHLTSTRDSFPSFSGVNCRVKDVVKPRSNVSKKLLTLGMALLVMPDPATDIAAIPVLVASKIMQKRQASNVKDVYDEMRTAFGAISSVSFR